MPDDLAETGLRLEDEWTLTVSTLPGLCLVGELLGLFAGDDRGDDRGDDLGDRLPGALAAPETGLRFPGEVTLSVSNLPGPCLAGELLGLFDLDPHSLIFTSRRLASCVSLSAAARRRLTSAISRSCFFCLSAFCLSQTLRWSDAPGDSTPLGDLCFGGVLMSTALLLGLELAGLDVACCS